MLGAIVVGGGAGLGLGEVEGKWKEMKIGKKIQQKSKWFSFHLIQKHQV